VADAASSGDWNFRSIRRQMKEFHPFRIPIQSLVEGVVRRASKRRTAVCFGIANWSNLLLLSVMAEP
jgi:hypothetical protein